MDLKQAAELAPSFVSYNSPETACDLGGLNQKVEAFAEAVTHHGELLDVGRDMDPVVVETIRKLLTLGSRRPLLEARLMPVHDGAIVGRGNDDMLFNWRFLAVHSSHPRYADTHVTVWAYFLLGGSSAMIARPISNEYNIFPIYTVADYETVSQVSTFQRAYLYRTSAGSGPLVSGWPQLEHDSDTISIFTKEMKRAHSSYPPVATGLRAE